MKLARNTRSPRCRFLAGRPSAAERHHDLDHARRPKVGSIPSFDEVAAHLPLDNHDGVETVAESATDVSLNRADSAPAVDLPGGMHYLDPWKRVAIINKHARRTRTPATRAVGLTPDNPCYPTRGANANGACTSSIQDAARDHLRGLALRVPHTPRTTRPEPGMEPI